jgi:rhamnosyltransferase
MQHVFIVGSKGIPGAYGGYETFVDKLTEYHEEHPDIRYHVACKSDHNGEETYHNARCFQVKVPDIGSAQAIYYDVAALHRCCQYIKANKIEKPIVYILACRIGPFAGWFKRRIHRLGGQLFINPDGHEWMRQKWSAPVRKYWKVSEKMMVKHADFIVCDSKNIEKYIQETYAKYAPKTTFIAYGAETRKSTLANDDKKLTDWYAEKELTAKGYYLVVGRFVPENNFETMIREFMRSKTEKDFAIITTANDAFLAELESRLHFGADKRIKFVGTVYDQELLMKIRENAYGYFHGHEVGGTNPSLLEALGSTDLNLLLDVGFNREVAEESALYWSKGEGDLAALIERADALPVDEIAAYGEKSSARIAEAYSWEFIVAEYERLFLQE